jgi:hypothetical protein
VTMSYGLHPKRVSPLASPANMYIQYIYMLAIS